MKLISPWRSLKTRITVFTLLLFIVNLWSLALYASKMLREDMEQMLGEQQFSALGFIASSIDLELRDRLQALEQLASEVPPEHLTRPERLQAFLDQHTLFETLFNGGVFATDLAGTAIADLPRSAGRIGTNYIDRESVSVPLREGRTVIGKPAMGKKLQAPIFSMTAPIRDAQGKVVGALIATINLGKASFLDLVTESRYGKGGGYLLIAPQYRLIVTATDRRRIMEQLPEPGANPQVDRFIDGYDGSAVFTTPHGESVLASAKRIPAAGWYLAVQIPTKEAFAPIADMERRLLSAAALLTLLAAVACWWLLHRQLAPLRQAVSALRSMTGTSLPAQPLPPGRQDEIGELITAFNTLLRAIGEREAALANAELFSRTVIDATPVPIAINDAQGKITALNRAFIQQLGYTPADIPTVEDWWPRAYPDPAYRDWASKTWQSHMETAKNSGNSFAPMEVDIFLKNRSRRRFVVSAAALEEQFSGTHLIILYDITERQQVEAELIQHRLHLEELVHTRTAELALSRDAAEAANRAKSMFLANMSHELRTPMNGVLGMTDLVLRHAKDPRQIDWLRKGQASAKHLLAIINDILDVSKIEADQLTLEEEAFSFREMLDDTLSMQHAAAMTKGLVLTWRIDPALPDALCGDAMRLRQILLNFTGNAIKFSDRGEIRIVVSATESDSTGVLLRIEVRDQGIGISPANQERLFQPFMQADDATTRKFGGTGLGLTISRRLARLMGGDTGVISEEGKGSLFWFTVRLRRGNLPQHETPNSHSHQALSTLAKKFAGARILVVEDEPVNCEILMCHLTDAGLAPIAASNGAEALESVNKYPIDLILMDVQMPIMNGLDATRAIRQMPGMKDIPILAQTANAFDEDRTACLAAGMNDYISKPISPDELYALLLLWLQVTVQQASESPTSRINA